MAYLDILSVVAVSRVVDRIDFVEMVHVNPKLLYTPGLGRQTGTFVLISRSLQALMIITLHSYTSHRH